MSAALTAPALLCFTMHRLVTEHRSAKLRALLAFCLLTGVFAASETAAQQPRLLSLEPEAESPLPPQANTPTPLGLYRDGVSGIDGLGNDVTSIVSADGSLLFTASTGDDALGVWRVSTDTGSLTQSALYKNGENGIDGLNGVRDLVLSPDGSLLFVTASGDNALSVWQVNAVAGTLTQSALYQNGRNGIDGLRSAYSLALSPDGRLLFVTAFTNDALSVWRVNAVAGTLTQRALYREGTDDIGGLDSVTAVALSPDGRLLFTGSDSDFLSVWQVNAADGTLVQNALYESGVGGAGLDNISAIVPSPDGRLLFVAASLNDSLAIWQVNAEAGTLLQRALYLNGILNTDGSSVIDGLDSARDIALTQDGSLLYVTGRDSNALSLWQVNAEDATIEQTALYKDDDGAEGLPEGVTDEFDGLGGAHDLTLSPDGSLLYVTASQDRTLSVFRTALPRLLSIAPIMLKVQISTALPAGTVLVITARQNDREVAREAVFSAGETAAAAVFEEGVLAAGRWIFTVTQTRPPEVVQDTASVQATAMVVQPQLVDLELRTPASSLEQGSPFPVTLTAVSAPAAILTVQVSLAGVGVAAETTTTILTATTPAQVLRFTVPANAPEALVLETRTTADRSLVAVSEATATVTVIQPISLMLRALQTPLLRGSTFAVTVTAEPAPPAGAELSVQVSLTADGVTTATQTAILTATTATLELIFTVLADAPAALMLATETTADVRRVTVTEATATVTVIQPLPVGLELSVPRISLLRGSTFAITVTADPPPPAEAPLSVALSLTGASVTTAIQTATLTATTSTMELTFTVPTDAPAVLTLATETTADVHQVAVTETTAMVTVVQPLPVGLELIDPPLPLLRGSTFAVTVIADPPPPAAADLSVQVSLAAGRMETATLTATASTMELTFTVPADAPLVLMLATLTSADERLVTVTEATAAITVIQPVVLVLGVPEMTLLRGSTFTVRVTADPPPPRTSDLGILVSLTANGVEIATQPLGLTRRFFSRTLTFTVPADAPQILTLATETVDMGLPGSRFVTLTNTTAVVTVVTVIQPVALVLSVPRISLLRSSTFAITVTADPPPPANADLSVRVSLTGASVMTVTQTVDLMAAASTMELTFTVPADAPQTLMLATETAADERLVMVTEDETAMVTVIQPVGLVLRVPPLPLLRGSTFAVTVTADPAPPANADLSVRVSLTEADVETAILTANLTAETSSQALTFTVQADAPQTLMLATLTSADESLVTVTEATATVTVIQPLPISLELSALPIPLLRGSTFEVRVTADPPPPMDADLSIVLSLTGTGVTATTLTADLTAAASTMELTFTVPVNAPAALMLATETAADVRRVTVTEATAAVTVIQPLPVTLMLRAPETPLLRGSTFAVTVTAEPPPPEDADLSIVLSLTGTGVTATTLTADLTAAASTMELTFTVPVNAPAALMLATETAADVRRVTVTEATAAVTVIQPLPVTLMLRAPETPLLRGSTFAVTVTAEPPPPEDADLSVRVSLTADRMETATLTAESSTMELTFTVPADAPETLTLATETTADVRRVTVTEATAAVTVIQPLPVTLMLRVPEMPLLRDSTFAVTVTAEPPPPEDADLSVRVSLTADRMETATLTAEASTMELTFTVPENAPAALMLATETAADVRRVTVTEATAAVTVIQPLPVTLMLRAPETPLLRGSTFAVTVTAEPPPPAEAGLSVQVSLTRADVETAILRATSSTMELTFTVPADAPETLTLATETAADVRRVTVTEATAMVTVIQPLPVGLELSALRIFLLRGSTFAVTVTADPPPPADAGLSIVLSLTGTGVMTATLTADLTATASTMELTFTVPADASQILMLATLTSADERLVTVTEAAIVVRVVQPVVLMLGVPEMTLLRGSTFPVTVTADPPPPNVFDLRVLVSLTANGMEIATQPVGLTKRFFSRPVTFTVPADAPQTLMLATRTVDLSGIEERFVMLTNTTAVVTVIQPVGLVLSVPRISLLRSSTFAITVTADPPPPANADLSVRVSLTGASVMTVTQTVDLMAAASTMELTFTVPADAPQTLMLATETAADERLVMVTEDETAMVTVIQPVGLVLRVPPLPLLRGSTFAVTVTADPAPPANADLSVLVSLTGVGVTTATQPATLTAAASTMELTFTVPADAPQTLMLATLTSADESLVAVTEATATVAVIQPLPIGLELSAPPIPLLRDSTFAVTVTADPAPPEDADLSVRVSLTADRMETATLTATASTMELTFTVPADAPETLTLATETVADERLVTVTEAATATVTVIQPLPVTLMLSVPPDSLVRGSTFAVTVTADPAPPPLAGLSVLVSLTGAGMETATLTAETSSQALTFTVPADAPQTLTLATETTADVRRVTVTEAATATVTVIQPLPVTLMLSVPPDLLVRGSTFAVTVTAAPPPPAEADLSVVLSLTGVGVMTATQPATLTAAASTMELTFTVPDDAPAALMLATETTADVHRVTVTEAATATVTVIQPLPVTLMLSVPPDLLVRGSTFAVTVTAAPPPPAEADLSVVLSLTGVGVMTATQPATLTAAASTMELTFTVPDDAPAALMLATETTADVHRVTVIEAAATVTVIQPQAVTLMLSVPPDLLVRGSTFAVTVTADPVPPEDADLSVRVSLTADRMETATQPATLTATASTMELTFTVPADAPETLTLATETAADVRRVTVTEATAAVTVIQPLPVGLVLSVPPDLLVRGSTFAVTVTADPAPPEDADLSVRVSLTADRMETATQPATLTATASTMELTFTVPENAPAALMLATETTADVRRVTVTEAATATVTVIQPLPVTLMLSVPPDLLVRGSTFAVTVTADPAPPEDADLSVRVSLTADRMETATLTATASTMELTFTVPADAPAALMLATETAADERLVTVTEAATATVTVIQPLPVTLMLSVPPDLLVRGSTFAVTVAAVPAPPAEADLSVLVSLIANGVMTATQPATLTAAASTMELTFTVPDDAPAALMLATETTADVRRVTVTETTAMVTVIQPQAVSLVLSVPPGSLMRGSTFAVTVTAAPPPPEDADLSVRVSLTGVGAEPAQQTVILTATTATLALTFTVPANAPETLMLATLTSADERLVTVTEAEAVMVTVIQPVRLVLRVPSVPVSGNIVITLSAEPPPPTGLSVLVSLTSASVTIATRTATLTAEASSQVLSFAEPDSSPSTLGLTTQTMADTSRVIVTEATATVEILIIGELDFVEPAGVTNMDDLVFALRYFKLCPAGGCNQSMADTLGLTDNLPPLISERSLPRPIEEINLGGEDIDIVQDIVILMRYLAQVPIELLLPDINERQQQLRIIREKLQIEE